ncbi:MAG: hypothetical protein ACR2N1_09470 [Rubripirellula sp.]
MGLLHLAALVGDVISAMVAANSTLILGSTIQQSDVIPAMAVETTTGNPVVSADLYSAGFQVCGVIGPLLLGAMDAVLRGVLEVVIRDTLDVTLATAAARDAKGKRWTFSRWKSLNQMAK